MYTHKHTQKHTHPHVCILLLVKPPSPSQLALFLEAYYIIYQRPSSRYFFQPLINYNSAVLYSHRKGMQKTYIRERERERLPLWLCVKAFTPPVIYVSLTQSPSQNTRYISKLLIATAVQDGEWGWNQAERVWGASFSQRSSASLLDINTQSDALALNSYVCLIWNSMKQQHTD